ncbi:MAG: protease modulator HflC [Geminicoccaceae bacterium]|jgi:membrane protease subunit HflC
MNPRITLGIGAAVVVGLFMLLNAVFTVHQTQQALVLQFGNPVDIVQDPGLHLKVPFIQQVEYFDKRVLDFDAPSVELVLGDQKRLVVDAFARYRITDALRFRQSVGNEQAFRGRLEPIVFSSLRSVLGEAPLFTLLSNDRTQIMNRIKSEANKSLAGFGVALVDVRIKRADLPPENSQAIFQRMQTERQREAKELRAQGAEVGQRIRARADRERRVLIAEAERESQILRGQGDAEAIRIFADAFGQDPEFFDFYRSLQAYRESMGDGSTTFVLSPDSEFFRFFNGRAVAPGAAATGPGAPAAPAAAATPPDAAVAPAAAPAP